MSDESAKEGQENSHVVRPSFQGRPAASSVKPKQLGNEWSIIKDRLAEDPSFFCQFDSDGDGKIDEEEWAQIQRLVMAGGAPEQSVQQLDPGRYRRELKAFRARLDSDPEFMAQFDANGNGVIDPEEWDQIRLLVAVGAASLLGAELAAEAEGCDAEQVAERREAAIPDLAAVLSKPPSPVRAALFRLMTHPMVTRVGMPMAVMSALGLFVGDSMGFNGPRAAVLGSVQGMAQTVGLEEAYAANLAQYEVTADEESPIEKAKHVACDAQCSGVHQECILNNIEDGDLIDACDATFEQCKTDCSGAQ